MSGQAARVTDSSRQIQGLIGRRRQKARDRQRFRNKTRVNSLLRRWTLVSRLPVMKWNARRGFVTGGVGQ